MFGFSPSLQCLMFSVFRTSPAEAQLLSASNICYYISQKNKDTNALHHCRPTLPCSQSESFLFLFCQMNGYRVQRSLFRNTDRTNVWKYNFRKQYGSVPLAGNVRCLVLRQEENK